MPRFGDGAGTGPSGLPPWLEGLTLYLRGALMGFADVIPGVSGGTVALIVGVYERLILGLATVFRVPVLLVRSGLRGAWRGIVEIPWFFLVTLGLGIGSAFIIGANVIPGVYERWTLQANALFFGLILGSLAVPWHRIQVPRRRNIVIAGVAAVIAFILTGFPQREAVDPSVWLIGGAAMVAVSAMVLPGVSGAYLLHVFGVWVPTLEAVRGADFAFLGVFALGALAGAVVIVAVVSWLLKHHHDVTLAALVGLMLGALRALWPWVDDERMALPDLDSALIVGLLLIAGGFFLVRLIDHWGRQQFKLQRRGSGEGGGEGSL